MFKFETPLSPRINSHLSKVYGCLATTMASATIGTYCNIVLGYGSPGTGLLAFVVLLALCFMSPTKDNLMLRFGLLNGFGFLKGISLGPLIGAVMSIDPSIIFTAFF